MSDQARWRITLSFVILAFAALGVLYSVVTPLFESPDETFHYAYVRYVAEGKGLPVLGRPDAAALHQEAGQAPLYYVLGAAITFWIDAPDSAPFKINPQSFVGIPSPGNDNKNLVLHEDTEGFPYQGVSLAIHLLRGFSVLLATGTVLLIYLIALELMPQKKALALGAAALGGFVPQFLFIAGSVNNDNLVVFLSTLCLYLMLRFARTGPRWWQVLLVGCVAGLAAISKTTGLGLLPVATLWLAWLAWRNRSPRLLLQGMALLTIGWLAMANWWYIHNWLVYGEPTGLVRHLDVQGRRSQPAGLLELFHSERRGFLWSFWGVFGIFALLAPMGFYRVVDVAFRAIILGLLLRLASSVLARRLSLSMPALLSGLWLLIVFAGVVRWTQVTTASQGRLLFPAIAPIAIAMALGLTAFVPRRWEGSAGLVAACAMLGVSIVVPLLVIGPGYAPPPVFADEARLPAAATRINATYDDKVELLAYHMKTKQAASGQRVRLTLYWRALAKMDEDYSVFVHIIGEDGKIAGQEDRYPGRGLYPTSRWLPGEIIEDEFEPRLLSVNAPFAAPMEAGLYQLQTQERLPARDSQGLGIGSSAPLGTLNVSPKR